MTILLMPTLNCNLRCLACFEDPIHSNEIVDIPLNLSAMENTLDRLMSMSTYRGSGIGVHGGECLMVSPVILDKLFSLQRKYGCYSSVVTNLTLLTPSIIRLFKKYDTYVSVSIDGPPDFNLLRGMNPNNPEITAKYNELLNKNIRWLRDENIHTSVMCIINKINSGNSEKINRMIEWFKELYELGIKGGRINPMYANGKGKEYELTNDELLYAYKEYAKMTFSKREYNWLPFREMLDNLLGFSSSPCVFGGCDYLCTQTTTIFPDGSIGNCDRTFSDGINLKSETGPRNGRVSALSQTQCAGCKYFNICKGGCPAEGLNGDWRNKTRFCEAYYGTYEFIKDYALGLIPNIRLNEPEPFKPLVWQYTVRPTTFANYGYREQQLTQTSKPVNPNHGDSHGDEHQDKPHGDHVDETHNDGGNTK